MLRCIACQSYRDVRMVDTLPWCVDCRETDLPDELACGFSPDFTAAVLAERARRRLPVQVEQS